MYIDEGKPTPALMAETLRNLREIAPTVYFNVPTGFDAIAQAMADRRHAAQDAAVARCACSSTRAPPWRSRSGTACFAALSARSVNAS